MKLFRKYNERSQKIERFMMKNKLFCLAIAVTIIIALAGKISDISENVKMMKQSEVSVSEEQDGEKVATGVNLENEADEKVATSGNLEETDNKDNGIHWRFYWIDLVVLVVGGGFCGIQIIRERAKTKEKLQ